MNKIMIINFILKQTWILDHTLVDDLWLRVSYRDVITLILTWNLIGFFNYN